MKFKYTSSMFIAETRSGVPSPVFWDPHSSIYNAGRPVTIVTGAPGQGKTYAGQIMTAISAIMGKTTIAIDYKGDMLRLVPLKDELGVPLTIWNLADKSLKGVLDPFGLSDVPGEQLSMAIQVIDLFVGGLDREDRQAILPELKDLLEEGGATMVKAVTKLRESRNKTARTIGAELEAIKSLEYASICFYNGLKRRKPPKLIDGGLTIATLSTMALPQTPEEAKETQDGRLASGILYLLTDYIRRLLASDDMTRPKTFIIDEAWAILATPAGEKIVKSVALLGRSKNLATVLITQNPSHLDAVDIDNTVGTRFSFSASDDQAEILVKAMKLPQNEGFEGLIASLPPYICMMSDYKSDFGLISFSNWKKDWEESFATNPYDLMKKKKAERIRREKALAAQARE